METSTGEPRLRIGKLAHQVGVNAKTIRYYEQIGLVSAPTRTGSGYRLYHPADADRLRFIKRVQQLGFTLGEIREVLALRDRGEAPCPYVTERLERHARDIDHAISELTALKGELARLRQRARGLPPPDREPKYCHILEEGRR
jgi:DNA-binding transcriptional MerR regulator